jgi:hypothetical protein
LVAALPRCTTVFQNLRGARKFSQTVNSDSDFHLAKTPRARRSETFFFLKTLRLCAFARKFRDLVAALPRWDLRGERNQSDRASLFTQKFEEPLF